MVAPLHCTFYLGRSEGSAERSLVFVESLAVGAARHDIVEGFGLQSRYARLRPIPL
jgi:hypothetical protein